MNRATQVGLVALCLALTTAFAARAGVVRCWIDHGAVVVPAAYGPIAGDFVVDLSRAKSQLHDTAAQTAGWTRGSARWTLRFAGQTRRAFPMTVADLDMRIAGFPTNIAGILGADVLDRFTLDLDLDPCRLRLTRGSRRRDPRDPRMRAVAGVPAVFAAISDGVTARAGWFTIDTASAGSRIADAEFSRPLPNGIDAGDRARPPARLRAVSVGDVLVEQTPAGLMTAGARTVCGSLGLSIWARVHLRIDGRAISARS
jgi:hypothetical protein